MVDAILHIGFGKTGTSSIQRYLCQHDLTGTNIVYCALNEHGKILNGEHLRAAARRKMVGYVPSTPLPLSGDPMAAIEAIRKQGRVPLFSQEDWSRTLEPLNFLHGVKVKVIAYVRPQVEWFNSGWWQWWRWTDSFDSPADVLKQKGLRILRWAEQLEAWKHSPLVSEVTVRLHNRDVVFDFLSMLGCTNIQSTPRINQSLSPTILKLYQSEPAIRRYDASEMDALFSSIIDDKRRAPWVVCPDLMRQIIAVTADDNRALREYLSPEQRKSMDTDLRWWSEEAYAERRCETLGQLTTEEMLPIVSRLSQALLAAKNR